MARTAVYPTAPTWNIIASGSDMRTHSGYGNMVVKDGYMGHLRGWPFLRPSLMKTTIEISDDLLMRARQAALERNTTLRAIVEEALERALGHASDPVPALRTITWGSSSGQGSRALDSKAVRVALRREREGPQDDDYWRRRFGFVPPAASRR